MRALAKKGSPSTCQKDKAFQTWTLQPNAETMGHPSCRPCCCTLHTRRLESRFQMDPRTPVCVAAHGRSTPSRSARLSEQLRCTGGRARLLTPPSSLEVDPNSGVSSSKSPDKGLCVTFHITQIGNSPSLKCSHSTVVFSRET